MNAAGTLRFAWVSTLSVLVMALAACQPTAVRLPDDLLTPIAPIDTTGAKRYTIDGASSEIHILVYRAGPMARLGHDHVVSSKDLTGVVFWHEELARSRVEMVMPIASLIVDDPLARADEGDQFAAEVSQDAREGTYRNLMRADVLDVEHFPTIALQSVAVSGNHARPTLLMRITIKGATRDVSVPVNVRRQDDRSIALLIAQGEFDINQSDFGITPFSVAAGALRVQDRLTIRFKVVATPGPNP